MFISQDKKGIQMKKKQQQQTKNNIAVLNPFMPSIP